MSTELENLIREITSCEKCNGLVIDKPCLTHDIYRKALPNKPLILVISESPPPGFKEDYLYNTSHKDNLRKTLAETLGADDKKIIELLYSKHVFWTTAIKCRPRDKKHLEELRKNCCRILELEIKTLEPDAIVALGLTAQRSLSDLKIKPRLAGYHPLYYSRKRRLNELKNILEEVFGLINKE